MFDFYRKALLINTSFPEEQQVQFTFSEFSQKKFREILDGKKLSEKEVEELNQLNNGKDISTMCLFNSRISQERLKNWHPELADADLDNLTSEIRNQLWLDAYEYRNIIIVNSTDGA